MNILYYDCFSGISGDMNLAAMIGLGVNPNFLCDELSKLGLDDEFSIKISEDSRKGIFGTRVDVELAHHHHDHGHTHNHGHHHHHEHRNLKDIEKIINSSNISEKVKTTSLAIFKRVAKAEAKIHGSTLYEVHFHEVGATDSIVDIVGAAICFHALKIDEIWCSAIELGSGFVNCAHGKIPVPAPATSEILTGKPTTQGAVPKETTTPTGAAILAELVDHFPDSPRMAVQKTAYGIGHRDNEIPNVLRVQLAKVEKKTASLPTVPARLLQCNIDDMTGEMLGAALDQLMEDGAMDVHFTPIVMKKNRPATTLSLLCGAEDEDKFKRLIFKHTTTNGIKSIAIEKTTLGTSFDKLETPLGPVTMKNALLDGKIIRSKPELEDCRALAKAHEISLSEVYLQIGKVREI
ncbi:nickel pincer cofactor biosynthesis protein LarC [Marinifilum sp. JC120]|nr:nickel pincer cofactor biosynthesis protein LarC [Marinifilum sp. JC120]